MRHFDLFSGYLGFSEAARRVWRDDYQLVACCEIDRWCQMVERRHRPSVIIFDDVKELTSESLIARGIDPVIDLVTFGSPCQDFSMAGLRSGMAGERSNLVLEAVRILEEIRPRWFVFENVPGLVSSWTPIESPPNDVPAGSEWTVEETSDLGAIFSEFSRLGYWYSARSLDSQYFGVAQRRERLFVVGCLGDPRGCTVLFEPESVCWNPPPRREKGKGVAADVAPSIGASGRGFNRAGESRGQDPVVACSISTQYGAEIAGALTSGFDSSSCSEKGMNIVPDTSACLQTSARRHNPTHQTYVVFDTTQITNPENRCRPEEGKACHPLSASAHAPAIAFSCKDDGRDAHNEVARTLRSTNNRNSNTNGGGQLAVAVDYRNGTLSKEMTGTLEAAQNKGNRGHGVLEMQMFQESQSGLRESSVSGTLRSNGPGHDPVGTRVRIGMAVRRLTPVECHRLQGMPDDWCAWGIDEKGKRIEISDSQQYRMLGNGVTLPVVEWIMGRIRDVESP